MSPTSDPDHFDFIRAWFAAFNRGEADRLAALYADEAKPTLKQRLGIIPPRVVDEGYAPTITGQATIQ